MMDKEMKSTLKDLVSIPGPPGQEGQVRAYVQSRVEPLVDQLEVDALGNLIVRLEGREAGGPLIMISAHLDEIGLTATHIDQKGFVRFSNLGGVYPEYLPGGRVRFLNGTRGVIHAEGEGKRSRVPPLKKMYIDVGAASGEDHPVQVGDPAVFEGAFQDLGGRLVSKALDDRVGVALLISLIRRMSSASPPAVPLAFVFTVREEVPRKGAGPAAFHVQPDLALAVDVTSTGDTPRGGSMEVSLGKGPAVKIRDKYMLADPAVVQWMTGRAEKEGLPYQREILEKGSTEAAPVQISRSGVPAGGLCLPCRYVHSPSEMIDEGDMIQALDLLESLLRNPPALK